MLLSILIVLLFIKFNNTSGYILSIAQHSEKKYPSLLQKWIKNCEKIYYFCHQPLPLQLEASNKIGKSYNTSRYSIFIKEIPPFCIYKILSLMNVPIIHQQILYKAIQQSPYEVMYGTDLSLPQCGRIYLNQGKEKVTAWEWLGEKLYKKKYSLVNKEIIIKELERYPINIKEGFLLCLPENNWEDCCIKYDEREGDVPCSLYFSPKYSPKLRQIYPTLSLLIREICEEDMTEWYNNYKECSVSWLVLTNKKNIELSVYFNTEGRISDFLESKIYGVL